ncbi:inositol polyphosphate 5-phosphatase K [Octopus bimaculoides]|nr:inositol polyphosphate 5-phosphatase K [Octopus bimaculoides]
MWNRHGHSASFSLPKERKRKQNNRKNRRDMGKVCSKKFIPIAKTKGSKTIRIYLCTWNVGTKPPPDDLASLLALDTDLRPDIYVIGLQEVSTSDLSATDNPWTIKLTSTFKDVRLSGMLELGFCRQNIFTSINGIESEKTKTGFGGWWGNKGGVCIRFDVNGINMCIVNSHLAAHRDQTPERIMDLNSILEDQKFRDDDVNNILDHDYVLWLGDLNFRLDDLPREEVLTRIKEKDYSYLLHYDQLNKTRSQGLAFVDFKEGPITFPPTYKFDVETEVYDTSEKQRVPAWCDRILWLAHDDSYEGVHLDVKQLHYKHHPSYKTSDHRPVTSLFEVKILSFASNTLPVLFHQQNKWSKGDVVVQFVINRYQPTTWDWVGLYKEDFTNINNYEDFEYVVPHSKGSEEPLKVTFLLSKFRHLRGKHILLYIGTYKNTMLGLSNVFLINH